MFHRSNRGKGQVINSTKNVVETSTILAAGTNTRLMIIATAVENAALATAQQVDKGSKIHSIYLSVFAIAEGGEVANEVPLVDWYVLKDNADAMGTTFDAAHLPTPGATGVHENKRFIFHTEKGLAGGGDTSLSGVPMIFKGVLRIPRGFQTMRMGDVLGLYARANFATKICVQSIYKYYR